MRVESLISWGVLCLLAIIAAWLIQSSFALNPAVKVATGRAQGAAGLAALAPGSLRPLSAPERFGPANLADKINGKAPLYLDSGFVSLATQRFALTSRPSAWLELFVYDMGSLEQAFAVYSQQRRPRGQPLTLGRFAYQSRNALFVVHGRYYLELVAGQADAALAKAMAQLAGSFVARRKVKPGGLQELKLFPGQGLKPHSFGLKIKNGFGYSGFSCLYTAVYDAPGGAITAFICRRPDPAAARRLAAQYVAFLGSAGAKQLKGDPRLPGGSILDVLGSQEVIFSIGPLVAGVHQAPKPEAALALALRLAGHLKEAAK